MMNDSGGASDLRLGSPIQPTDRPNSCLLCFCTLAHWGRTLDAEHAFREAHQGVDKPSRLHTCSSRYRNCVVAAWHCGSFPTIATLSPTWNLSMHFTPQESHHEAAAHVRRTRCSPSQGLMT